MNTMEPTLIYKTDRASKMAELKFATTNKGREKNPSLDQLASYL